MSLKTALASFEAKVKAFFSAEVVVAEAIGVTILQGLETIVTAIEPTVLNDVKTILQGIDAAFLAGSNLDSIVEEVIRVADADLKAVLSGIAPQALATIIGVLIKAL
jgi:hypothetical protein